MSYILDALKKSERDRAGAVDKAPSSTPPSAPHAWPRQLWPLALASGLVAGAVVAVIMIWRAPSQDPQEQAGKNAAAPTEAVPLSLSSVAELPPLRGNDAASASADRTIPQAPVAQTAIPALATRDDAPFLRQKPVEFQRQLPELVVTIHVYSPEESQRILFINNREYRRGDQVQDGLRVEEIIPDGALLSYHGEKFKLRRPY